MDLKGQFSSNLDVIQTVIHFTEALNARDLDGMLKLVTPQCIFENTYPPPDGTRYEGQIAFRAFWEDFFNSSSQAGFDIEDIFGWGNRCVMLWRYRWVDTTGEAGHIRGVDVYTLENGLIAEKLSYVKG
jgi:ketosteroid isomerase-like protein